MLNEEGERLSNGQKEWVRKCQVRESEDMASTKILGSMLYIQNFMLLSSIKYYYARHRECPNPMLSCLSKDLALI